MSTKKTKDSINGETVLPNGLCVERLKRAHALSAKLSDIGFWANSSMTEQELLNWQFLKKTVVDGDLKISC